jgi:hypothetical protein
MRTQQAARADIRSRPDDKIIQGQNGGEQRNGQVDRGAAAILAVWSFRD